MDMALSSSNLSKKILCIGFIIYAVLSSNLQAVQAPDGKIRTLTAQTDVKSLREIGPSVLPVLARQYESASEDQRATIAWIFYELGWESPDAKRVLMKDIQTQNPKLRLQVQWALGRVSNDTDVVEVLLNNMQNDSNPLFRDKAACALANDQIHLSRKQKARLYEGLIRALSDSKAQVRNIAMLALQIQTGQTKSFNPNGSLVEREASIQEWKKWLAEYQSNL
jgi:HEAT repeat protein